MDPQLVMSMYKGFPEEQRIYMLNKGTCKRESVVSTTETRSVPNAIASFHGVIGSVGFCSSVLAWAHAF